MLYYFIMFIFMYINVSLYASQMCQNLTTGQSHLSMQNIIKIIWEVMTILHEGN